VRVPIEFSERSLFGFLASTRLPLVSRLGDWIRRVALAGAASCTLLGAASLLVDANGFWAGHLPLSGALPALSSAPWFLLAWFDARRQHLRRAAGWLTFAVALLTVLAGWPRGVRDITWLLLPAVALFAGLAFGVLRGLPIAIAGAAAILLSGRFGPAANAAALDANLAFAFGLAGLVLGMALAGSLANRLLYVTLLTAQAERRDALESTHVLRRREKLLRHALRVDTVGELAGMVCHQLRNTFQVLLGHATLGAIADDSERRNRLALIEQTVEQAKPLLDHLMQMSHPEDGQAGDVDVGGVVARFLDHARHVLPSNIRLVGEVGPIRNTAHLDAEGLLHALWNLAINARQAIAGEGTITVRAGETPRGAWIEVADDGCGMAPEVRARIFEAYFTTKPPGQGTGLGLTAVARFVRSSRGTVSVASEVGRGTTFRLEFPTGAEAAKATG
jgi:signal transduction histidine kinase